MYIFKRSFISFSRRFLTLHASCLLSSYSNLRTKDEQMIVDFQPSHLVLEKVFHVLILATSAPMAGLSTRVSRVGPSSSYEIGFSCVNNTCCGCSDGICNAEIALSANWSRRQRSAFGVVHRPVTTKLGFLLGELLSPVLKG
ncbi:unnamed protein product [Calypogeia fissa]